MNKGELRTRFKAILNRRDCTDALADSFIGQGIQKVQRSLLIPSFERTLTVSDEAETISAIPIPSDFLSLKHIRTDYRTLDRLDIGDFLRRSRFADISTRPRYFTREGAEWLIWPTLAVGSELIVIYYGEDTALTEDTDESALSVIAPDVIIYAGLLFAADYFGDDRLMAWAQMYDAASTEVTMQALATEMSGSSMAVRPPYEGAEF